MSFQLYAHQKRFLERNPRRALLVWETGTGKTYAACEWLKLNAKRDALVVCPKNIVRKWEKDLADRGTFATVITRDEIKKVDISGYNTLVIDEAHDFASALFTKGRSQRATRLYTHIKARPNANVLLLSATPIRSTPWNLHTLMCYLGRYWPIKDFRDTYFQFVDRYGRMHYEPDKDWRIRIRKPLEAYADIVLMSDCADIPHQEHIVEHIPWTKKHEELLSNEYQEPIAAWHERHRAEQSEEKWKRVKELIDGYQKIIVVCYYREQIDDYVKRIGSEREVHVIHGGVSDQESIINAAQASKDCVLIVQASLGSGFDADTFSVMVFASMGFSYVSLVQMRGRINRIHNLHENTYYYLLGGKCDKGVHDAMEKHSDFDPIAYLNETHLRD